MAISHHIIYTCIEQIYRNIFICQFIRLHLFGKVKGTISKQTDTHTQSETDRDTQAQKEMQKTHLFFAFSMIYRYFSLSPSL